jgi:uncharacterized coiled-coil DUF342 family protein
MRLKREEEKEMRERRMNIFGEISKCKERRLTTFGSAQSVHRVWRPFAARNAH